MIKSIKFKKDFRCFKTGEMYTFKPGVNVLVGDQGSGKSTLIELLRSLQKKKGFNESDSSYRANSISAFSKIEEIVDIDADDKKVVAFDFERESPRDMSAIHFDMMSEQITAMKSSHGQGNLLAIDRVLKQVMNDQDSIGTIMLDEPDAAMSPRSCYALVNMINGVTTKWNKQIIVSAHNPIIIRGVHPLVKKEPFWTEVLSMEDKVWMANDVFMLLQLIPPAEKSDEKGTKENP